VPDLDTHAQPAIEKLLQAQPDQLFVELGMRQKAIQADPTQAGLFAPPASANVDFSAPLDVMKDFGQNLFNRLSKTMYQLACGNDTDNQDERKKLEDAFGLGPAVFATTMATVLVSSFAIAPAIAGVVAALAVKLFGQTVYPAMCDTWKKNLPA
jgi:hypothetical protein